MSVPNQKIITIHKPKYKENFLQIGLNEWQKARQSMTYTEFALYLYLAGNADRFNLELSRVAVELHTGMKKSAYHTAVNKLIALGYLVDKGGNRFDFYTSPVHFSEPRRKSFGEVHTRGKHISPPRTEYIERADLPYRQSNREIDKIDRKDNKDRSDLPAAKAEEKEIEQMDWQKRFEEEWKDIF